MSGPESKVSAKTSRRAFTLVELLVVIGIIALLISILLPTLNKARAQANAVGCLSNLKVMGQATVMYINEWKTYPGCYGNNAAGNVFACWPTRLRIYMKGSQGVFRCPTRDPSQFDWSASNTAGYSTIIKAGLPETGYGYKEGENLLLRDQGFFSYGYNDWGAGQTPAVLGNGPFHRDVFTNPQDRQLGLGGDTYNINGRELKASRVRKAAEMVEITDRNQDYPTAAIGYRYNIDPRDPNESPKSVHKDGANVLWADGHATWERITDLLLYDPKKPTVYWIESPLNPKWVRVAPIWNNDHQPVHN